MKGIIMFNIYYLSIGWYCKSVFFEYYYFYVFKCYCVFVGCCLSYYWGVIFFGWSIYRFGLDSCFFW